MEVVSQAQAETQHRKVGCATENHKEKAKHKQQVVSQVQAVISAEAVWGF